jgi:parallel beta-helix repeat protein
MADKLLNLCSLVCIASLLMLPQSVSATIATCVVPDNQGSLPAKCIRFDELEGWLLRPSLHDQAGDFVDDILVEFKPGIYRLAAPLTVDKLVTRNGRHKLTLAGAGATQTIFSGGHSLKFNPAPEALIREKNLPKNLVFASLQAAGIFQVPKFTEMRFGQSWDPGIELFYRGVRMPIARWPNSGYAKTRTVETVAGKSKFTVAGKELGVYKNEEDLRVGGFFAADWADESLQVGGIDAAGRVSFAGAQPFMGVAENRNVFFENALVDIDMPGEWQLNRNAGLVYFLPPKALQPDEVQVSQVLNGLVLKQVLNIEVRDIGFEEFRGTGLVLEQVDYVTLRDMVVKNVGGAGIQLVGWNTLLENVVVSETGSGGINMSGGERKTLQPGRLAIRRCRITKVGRLHKTYTPAVSLSGVGNIVEDSILRDGPHAAIVFHGNDLQIRGNLIEDFVKESDDAGAIYTGGDWSERGTVIEHNLLRNIGRKGLLYGAHGIYLDDQASGIIVKNNLISNVEGRSVFIGGGRDNTVSENIFARCQSGVYLDARGLTEIAEHGAKANQGYFSKLKEFNVSMPPYSSSYPALVNLANDEPGAPKNNIVSRNVFIQCPLPFIQPQAINGVAIAESVVEGNGEQAKVDEASVSTIQGLFSILVKSEVLQNGKTR